MHELCYRCFYDNCFYFFPHLHLMSPNKELNMGHMTFTHITAIKKKKPHMVPSSIFLSLTPHETTCVVFMCWVSRQNDRVKLLVRLKLQISICLFPTFFFFLSFLAKIEHLLVSHTKLSWYVDWTLEPVRIFHNLVMVPIKSLWLTMDHDDDRKKVGENGH